MTHPRYTHIKNVDFEKLTWILRQRKKDLGMTESDLSRESGLSSGGINNILRNKFNPSWKSLKGICTALKIDYRAAIEACKKDAEKSTGEPKVINPINAPKINTASVTNDNEVIEPVSPVIQKTVVQGTLELDIEPVSSRIRNLDALINNNLERRAVEYLLQLGYRLEKPVTVTQYVTL